MSQIWANHRLHHAHWLTAVVLIGCTACSGEPGNGLVSGVLPDGSQYEGTLKEGLLTGQGTIEWPDGSKYQGEFLKGLMHGTGHYDVGGYVYEGDFRHGQFSGEGTRTSKEGTVYQGTFEEWTPVGEGVLTYSDGTRYEGQFEDGIPNGFGKFTTPDGEFYEGGVDYGSYSGYGKLTFANGDVFVGQFEYDDMHGRGVLTYAEPNEDGITQITGQWRWGEHEDEIAATAASIAEHSEIALYSQPKLLAEALDRLAPGTPGEIELYLLSVAGDGTQEVFRREVEFVEQQFTERFTTADRILSLVNSRVTVGERPMATHTALQQSLDRVAQQMNLDEDILFLFMTSHGLSDHEFMLSDRGIQLGDLPASDLAEMLKATGIQWNVILVSACYSGGFIEPLQDDKTLILTSARHDRTSFGCADENDFAFFTRAFFHDSIPNSDSFVHAFELAQARVREMEEEEGIETASLPQFVEGELIGGQLERWRNAAPARPNEK